MASFKRPPGDPGSTNISGKEKTPGEFYSPDTLLPSPPEILEISEGANKALLAAAGILEKGEKTPREAWEIFKENILEMNSGLAPKIGEIEEKFFVSLKENKGDIKKTQEELLRELFPKGVGREPKMEEWIDNFKSQFGVFGLGEKEVERIVRENWDLEKNPDELHDQINRALYKRARELNPKLGKERLGSGGLATH